jgi:hypothetical protein
MEQDLSLEQLKATRPFTKIQRDGAPEVSLDKWNGVAPFASVYAGSLVRYFLDGNRLRVRRDLSHEEIWYTLSWHPVSASPAVGNPR